MKKHIFTFLIFLLNGCYYSFKTGCFYTPQLVTCTDQGEDFPYVAFFQKKETIGHTDPVIRWNDIKACGGINIYIKKNTFEIKNGRDSKGVINSNVIYAFENCMIKKGYVRLYYIDCGTQNPRWNKGKCNL
ncbi:hypothetical protein ACLSZW_03935 [Avibacterium avium]|uniref:hypothetical protein n=1 Tax=Avibacterium avium TaxID=751 RepID=UPI003BF7E1A5